VELDSRGNFVSLIRATRAVWTGEHWDLINPIIYSWENELLLYKPLSPTNAYREQPDTFRRHSVRYDELKAAESKLLVEDLRYAGLPYIEVQADYYHRFSFAAVSLIVMILSISMGGKFRKNILLMSLLASLSAAVVFYVIEMITMMMARLGYIPPIAGAWFPVIVFIAIGLVLLIKART
jgi:lipopolysaccharide export system permease protein